MAVFQTVSATFTGAEAYIDVTWPTDFAATPSLGGPTPFVTDAFGDVIINVVPTPSVDQKHGVRIQPSDYFSGRVDLLGYTLP